MLDTELEGEEKNDTDSESQGASNGGSLDESSSESNDDGNPEEQDGIDESVITHPRNMNGDINPNLQWFVVHTYSGYEEKAKKSLLHKAKEKSLAHMIGMVHIPQTEKETKTKTGKSRVISRTSFPGYMMVQIELNDSTKTLVKDTPKITGFVGDNKNPKCLPEHEVRAMLAVESEKVDSVESIEPEVLFNKGDAVKVTDGPFSNFDGVVDVVRPDKGKVRVLVSIFGRETPVELEYRQVEQI